MSKGYKRRYRRRVTPPEAPQKLAGGAILSKFPGTCWFCGEAFPEETPIRFVQRETVHEEVCFEAVKASQ